MKKIKRIVRKNGYPYYKNIRGYIYRQIDERYFEVSLWRTGGCTFKCYLCDQLFLKKIRPLVGNWVLLEHDSHLKEIVIVMVQPGLR